jgi:hypothetical protein
VLRNRLSPVNWPAQAAFLLPAALDRVPIGLCALYHNVIPGPIQGLFLGNFAESSGWQLGQNFFWKFFQKFREKTRTS